MQARIIGQKIASEQKTTTSYRCFFVICICAAAAWLTDSQVMQSQVPSATVPGNISGDAGPGYILRMTTREVLVEVVARDHDNHPVNDLHEGDFELFEGDRKDKASVRRISGFRVIDPDSHDDTARFHEGVVVLPLGGRCEIRSTVHYELAFHPTQWTSGIHTIRVTTTRKHITLSYRPQYYVGISEIAKMPLQSSADRINSELMDAACYHPAVPSSILLSAIRIESPKADANRFLLTLQSDTLDLAGINADTRDMKLEYGVCTFSRSGRAIGFWETSVHRSLDQAALSTALDAGWRERIEIPHRGNPALTRLVVLEPKSGNLGSIDLATEAHCPEKDETTFHEAIPMHTVDLETIDNIDRVGSTRSLGTVVPARGALCGDVYELPVTTTFLPRDFRKLNAVGSIFTDSFNVAEQTLRQGIPGSTRRSEWFGVDYYGEFWVDKPGKYEFVLNADDGADLYIDDRRIISDDGIHPPQTAKGAVMLGPGRHTMHLPYFEGPKYVNLILQVKPPNGPLGVFDIRNYARPLTTPASPEAQADNSSTARH
jgi:hypothetical protein